MKSLSLLLALFLAPALAAQEDNSKTDAPKRIDFDIKIESHGEGIPETVQKMIKLVAPEGAGKYHTLNLPDGRGTMVIEIETSGELSDVKWALLDSSNTEDALGCSLEDIPSGDCETDEGCCGKCDSTPKAFVRVNGEEVQLGMDNLPPEIRAHIGAALSGELGQGCPGQKANCSCAVKGKGGTSCSKLPSSCSAAASQTLWAVSNASARNPWGHPVRTAKATSVFSCNETASASCNKAASASCNKGVPSTCSKGSPSCETSQTLWASSPATGRNLWGGTTKASCGNTGSKSPWNRYL